MIIGTVFIPITDDGRIDFERRNGAAGKVITLPVNYDPSLMYEYAQSAEVCTKIAIGSGYRQSPEDGLWRNPNNIGQAFSNVAEVADVVLKSKAVKAAPTSNGGFHL
jgi:hypothetical protein